MSDTPPTLADVCRAAVAQHMLGVHTQLPGQVVSFDKSTQCAQVKCTLLFPDRNEDGTTTGLERGIFDKVPIIMPGGGDYGMTCPLAAGDFVLLLFFEQSADRWLAQGGSAVDPLDHARHKLSAPVGIGGLRPFNAALDELPDALVLRSPTEVRIGGNDATKKLVTEDALKFIMGAIQAAISTLDGVSQPHTELTALQTALGTPGATAAWSGGGLSDKARG